METSAPLPATSQIMSSVVQSESKVPSQPLPPSTLISPQDQVVQSDQMSGSGIVVKEEPFSTKLGRPKKTVRFGVKDEIRFMPSTTPYEIADIEPKVKVEPTLKRKDDYGFQLSKKEERRLRKQFKQATL